MERELQIYRERRDKERDGNRQTKEERGGKESDNIEWMGGREIENGQRQIEKEIEKEKERKKELKKFLC